MVPGLHADPIASVILALAILLAVAKLGAELAIRLGQPPVLGELLAGVVLGNLALLGIPGGGVLGGDPTIDHLAELGVLLLMFEIGLELDIRDMLRVGGSALLVAVVGVCVPFALGWGVAAWLMPGTSTYVHIFVGAALTATSVGITGRVLRDLGSAHSAEARIILGAAVIDDVLSLVVLAVVAGTLGAIERGADALSPLAIAGVLIKAVGFLGAALVIGQLAAPRLMAAAARMRSDGTLLALGLVFCFVIAWVAALVGLAPLVGAFAAGLVLERVHYRDFVDRGEHELEELVHPIVQFTTPVFFVVMGMQVDLRVFGDPAMIGLAAALIVVACAGKLAGAIGVRARGVDRLTVGIGMVPRGEVGLIFVGFGQSLAIGGVPVIAHEALSAIVVMVIVTTLVTPPALRWSLRRHERAVAGAT